MGEMKSIREIAEELGISKQAVAKRVATLPPTEVTTDNQRRKLVTPEGVRILREATANRQPTNNQPGDNQVVAILQAELEAKNRQIEDLTAALANMTETLKAAQALHAGTMQKQLGSGRGFLARLFGRGGAQGDT